jgi:hypothetical protein
LSKQEERPASKPKSAAAPKKRNVGKATKLKSSSWYNKATRAVAISKGKPRQKSDEVIE